MKKDRAAAILGRTLFPRAEDIPQSLAMAFMRMMMAAEVRPSEVRPAELRPSEVRPAEVRTDVGVLITPGVPSVHALLEPRDVLVVRHGSSPEVLRRTMPLWFFRRFSATTLFWDGLTM